MDRIESDNIGEVMIPEEALYGINSIRAKENFPGDIPFQKEWYRATGQVKQACYKVYRKFSEATKKKYAGNIPLKIISPEIIDALENAAVEVSDGLYYSHFIIPAMQGGAGTSINMNINEIITNAALINIGDHAGDYSFIDPIEHANVYQSTNDVIPTALTVASMKLMGELEESINLLRKFIEEMETAYRDYLRPGYTQMQEAVPSSFGKLFSAYNDALSRDWWRVSKCKERIKVVNLGGGATGTGLAIPRFFIMEVVPELRHLTSLPLTRSENLNDATSNLDKWVEIHSTLKAHAVNLEKIASDIRLLAADISKADMVSIQERQRGSSLMPGKVNPVIPEFIISSAHKIYSNDMIISNLCGQGCLDLNAYLPLIGHSVIESLKILINANISMAMNLIKDLKVNRKTAYETLIKSPVISTALIPDIGYNKASEIALYMKENKSDIFKTCEHTGYMNKKRLEDILKPGNLLKMGFSIDDIMNKSD
ncbi:MAG TPA: aspartate ammonia-lyase [Bacteroidales bacterium]|nr:aspartate ammonia-lyase [Bacteroidales bacterium]